jgi:tetratricopeptide (TPR) repeat protein
VSFRLLVTLLLFISGVTLGRAQTSTPPATSTAAPITNTPTQGQAPTDFDAANKLYYEGKFPEAASAYESLLRSGQNSAVVYFNLGNALLKSGHVGQAIAAYRQAERITPRDPDVRANLRFARNQVQGPTLSANRLVDWIHTLTLNEWAVLAAVCFWIFFALLIWTQVRPYLKRQLRLYLGVSLILAIVCGSLLAFSLQEQRGGSKIAVVTVPDVVVRHGPLDASPNAFPVHDGAEMRVLERRDDWLQVSPDPTRIGWIRRDQVAVLN